MKVLIAEDDAEMRASLTWTLERAGRAVTAVADGVEAWDRFREGAYDVVLTDMVMPNLNGHQLCRMVRSLARETYPYIVMLTGAAGADQLVAALEAGADDFLTKPFDRAVLLARLRVAERMQRLHGRVSRLEGLLSMCCHCHRVRQDDGAWVAVQQYLQAFPDLQLSHGICQHCLREHYPDTVEAT